jgi:hypothetical protein
MTGRNCSTRAQAEHYRQLAEWTSDPRTQQILTEMARELEAGSEEEAEVPAEAPVPAPPRSLS